VRHHGQCPAGPGHAGKRDGFHLRGPLFEPLIPRVCAELERLSPAVLVPAHCTGWAAQHALANRFPASFLPSTVGTRLEL
jgi:7,8-dihydropterin-6-yl-methyl-4-(beta-D-ribofuranosyl)aminobenzene 5'-phosphate synthase